MSGGAEEDFRAQEAAYRADAAGFASRFAQRGGWEAGDVASGVWAERLRADGWMPEGEQGAQAGLDLLRPQLALVIKQPVRAGGDEGSPGAGANRRQEGEGLDARTIGRLVPRQVGVAADGRTVHAPWR